MRFITSFPGDNNVSSKRRPELSLHDRMPPKKARKIAKDTDPSSGVPSGSSSSSSSGSSSSSSSAAPPSASSAKDVKVAVSSAPEKKSNEIHHEEFDLDGYASNYAGHTKIQRLVWLGERCPEKRVQAFRMAIDELKKGADTTLYTEVISRGRELLGDALGDEMFLIKLGWEIQIEMALRNKTS